MRLAARAVVAAAVLAFVVTAPAGARSYRFEDDVIQEINAMRMEHGLPPLRVSAELTAAANAHSREMLQYGFFSHLSAKGVAFSRRMRTEYRAAGYRTWSVGENLIWSSPDLTADQAVQAWFNDPPHRANLLSPKWREIGLGSGHASDAPGLYGGRAVTVLTADFGVRR
jgi:uncharacterized protein YkwD